MNTEQQMISNAVTEFDQRYFATKDLIRDYLPMGLPADPVSSMPPPGLESTVAANPGTPFISSLQEYWDVIKNDSESAVNYLKGAVETGYETVKGGIGTVYDDITKPVSSIIDNAYWKIILAVVVVGGVIYFAGKSGALRVNA